MKVTLKQRSWALFFFIFSSMHGQAHTIKVFHLFDSFGVETQELKNSISMTYNAHGSLVDSTIYTHTVPLSEKYVYVSGPNEGLKLQRHYEKESVLSYRFENSSSGKRIATSLYGIGDTLYWKEFYKYDDTGKRVKQIRYNPKEAVNPEMMVNAKDPGQLIWGEQYNYDSTGTVLEHKELYDGYTLEITTYTIDSTNVPHKKAEYFDPSVIFRTIFFHDESGRLAQEINVERLGKSIGSKSYEYDILGRVTKVTFYNSNGVVDETINTVFDDNQFKQFDYHADSTLKLISKTETLFNDNGLPYIKAFLDGEERLLEKQVFSYDQLNRLTSIRFYDMIRKGHRDKQIPVRVQVYEYD